MTPPQTATATRVASVRQATRPAADSRRANLRVLEPRRRRRLGRVARVLRVVPAAMVVGSLLAVVVGHAVLDASQVRLSEAQAQLSAVQAQHREDVITVSGLETPSRIVGEAQAQLHMTAPGQVVQLPSVPLNVPLPPPKVGGQPATSGSSTSTNQAAAADQAAPSGEGASGETASTTSSGP